MTRSCDTCAHRFYKDFGYSDYTVEGTNIYCQNDLNPDYPTNEPSYIERNKEPHSFAETCSQYVWGREAPHFSVDERIHFEDESA